MMFIIIVLMIIYSFDVKAETDQNEQLIEGFKRLEERLERQEELNLKLQDMLRHEEERNNAQDAIIKQQQKEIVKLQKTCICNNEEAQTDMQEEIKKQNNITSISIRNKVKRKLESFTRVTRELPERVAFSSFLDHNLEHLGIDHPIIYNKVLLNEGAAYNANSGMFTCPMDGLHVFYFSVSTNGVHQVVAKLVVDGTNQVDAISDTYHANHEAQGGNLVVISLQRGQQVWVANYRWVDISVQDSNVDRFSTFSGFMLY
ncbi:complement C1q subcomponent subunit C-like [Mercenaria mercenaria]|uniref:complement C1q subcomponent subunit C-like n=1 Tax=Mercenaria mercenaria TaxID=6596 RepID=UPI00234F1AF1|nr:complement C1q subcomponent subunit C-like [Mercenaria mercenaria]